MLSTSLFDYDLPPELIAQHPAERRDGSRMLVLDRVTGECEIHPFGAIREYLSPGDALIYNDTRVLRGRMYARKNGDPQGAKFELLLVQALDPERRRWNVLLKPGKRALPGVFAQLLESDGTLNENGDGFTVLGRSGDGGFGIEFNTPDSDRLQARYGHIPLPPYITRGDETADSERYQTVYAEKAGAVAAPTAGLHFTPEILADLAAKGVREAAVTLHVGPGTFKPVSVENAEEHQMHSEEYFLTPGTAELINATHAAGNRVLAVGTTTVRTLESCADPDGIVHPAHGNTQIFLYPPYRIRAVDLLLTNFHLPKSTLLMLVSCFCDREKVLAAYELAIREKMRFYSYGDCMLLK
ncbi:tRNA preQ1(34) S-adenosylmethionine ribosyltransferase-isomerase QueA [uncultured Victivallis sp.]|uniref:tRNA preQ1(34) S-adenosylmethionine ribosyltransferase-isomerase QueA n=1 Tax=uncultured Victivallis sp. TaxID=354118 RepID=UPI0025F6B6A5|nr:tRNA preQ1(34) S-adenosylmethionine ribosyltransferase-isomerase QueA [uncultured Victivallis sp.]